MKLGWEKIKQPVVGKVAVGIGSAPRTEEIFSCQQYCCIGRKGVLKGWVLPIELVFLGLRIPALAASVPHRQHVGKYYSPAFLPSSSCIPEIALSFPAHFPLLLACLVSPQYGRIRPPCCTVSLPASPSTFPPFPGASETWSSSILGVPWEM